MVELDIGAVRALAEAMAGRIESVVLRTPLRHSPWLSSLVGGDVYLKLECVQVTGSFKVRGAAAMILSHLDEVSSRGFVTASSGNHGRACAHVGAALGCEGLIVLPETVAPAKLAALRRYPVEIVQEGLDAVEAEAAGRRIAAASGRPYVPPYNALEVVAGQGTIGLEIEKELDAETVLVPVGGGGLIGGIAAVLKHRHPTVRVVGCQPSASAVMAASVRAGYVVELHSDPTIADGVAGGIESSTVTFAICRDLVDEFTLVPESEIVAAIRLVYERESLVVEGSAALPVATLLRDRERYAGRRVVVVLSGAGIGATELSRALATELPREMLT